jgi:predicted nucleic acid-binding Zn ribbon protein
VKDVQEMFQNYDFQSYFNSERFLCKRNTQEKYVVDDPSNKETLSNKEPICSAKNILYKHNVIMNQKEASEMIQKIKDYEQQRNDNSFLLMIIDSIAILSLLIVIVMLGLQVIVYFFKVRRIYRNTTFDS